MMDVCKFQQMKKALAILFLIFYSCAPTGTSVPQGVRFVYDMTTRVDPFNITTIKFSSNKTYAFIPNEEHPHPLIFKNIQYIIHQELMKKGWKLKNENEMK